MTAKLPVATLLLKTPLGAVGVVDQLATVFQS
jgi:hypothetical protein